jgi:hypothetical protein
MRLICGFCDVSQMRTPPFGRLLSYTQHFNENLHWTRFSGVYN